MWAVDSVELHVICQDSVDVGYFGIVWGQGSFETLLGQNIIPPALPFLIAMLYAMGMNVLAAMRFICVVSFGLLLFSVSSSVTRLLEN